MNESVALFSVSPQAEARMASEQLREDSAIPLFLGTGLVGVLLVLFGDELFAASWHSPAIGLFAMCLPIVAFWFKSRSLTGSYWLLLCGWVVGIGWAGAWLPGVAMPVLFLLPLVLAFVYLDGRAGLGLAALLLAGGVGAHVSGWGGLSRQDWTMVFFLHTGALFLLWLSVRSYHQTIYWHIQNYRSGRMELEIARDRQGELNQVLRDLADANAQMVRLNQMLNTARQQAEEAERVKAEFVANVSHELRTPLNMVLGYCEMIMNVPAAYGEKLPERLLADILSIQRNSQHLTALINDVLDISQIEAHRMILNKEWLELPRLLEEACLAVQPLLESRDLSLKIVVAPGLPPVFCDRTRIRQVLLNLLSNAARFTEVGGITVSAHEEEENIKVVVSDTGPGIAASDIPKLFQPFRQVDGSTRRKQGGSGLGLNISRNFIELHGGKMGVESEISQGSRFWFSLPVVQPSTMESGFRRWLSTEYNQIRHPTTAIRQRILPHVLVVEPDEYLSSFSRQYENEIETTWAGSPAEARRALEENQAQIVLVRGETAGQTRDWGEALAQATPATSVVACSIAHQRPGESLGVANYLLKPVHHQQLLDAIQAVPRPVSSILLVDDDIETLQLFSRLLSTRPHRYRILQASNGYEALDFLRKRKVDLVILDLIMPGMDGFAVLQAKNHNRAMRDIPVIVLTADDPDGAPRSVQDITVLRRDGFSYHDLFHMLVEINGVLDQPE
jgi:signal transduction histidine kinase/CheY-like chemotaxis protein